MIKDNSKSQYPWHYHGVVFFHLAEPREGEIKANDDVSQSKFFSIDEIKNLDIAESVEWVLKDAGFWTN